MEGGAGRASSSSSPSIDYFRCLRLFTRICTRYRSINEVLKLFQLHRRHHGLLCFRQLLAVYSHLSIYSLEHRAQLAGVSIHSGDVCRALATLEQCNASFVKCAIPLILAPSSPADAQSTSATNSGGNNSGGNNNSGETPGSGPTDTQSSSSSFPSSSSSSSSSSPEIDVAAWQAFGCVIIKEIFLTAESVLDLLAAQSLTDDVMNVLRYG